MTESNNIYNEKREKAKFPARLSELLEKNKESQEDLAKIIGVSQQQIDHYTKGHSKPKIENLITIAMHYGVSVDWLIGVPDAPEKMDATKQSVMEYTGLSETLLDAIMEANRIAPDILFLIFTLTDMGDDLEGMQSLMELYKNPQVVVSGFELINSITQEPVKTKDRESFHIELRDYFRVSFSAFLQRINSKVSKRLKVMTWALLYWYEKDYSKYQEIVKTISDPWQRNILEQLKGELYGIDNSTKE